MTEMISDIYTKIKKILRKLPFLVKDRFVTEAKLKSISLPTLVVHGTADDVTSVDRVHRIASVVGSKANINNGADTFVVDGAARNDICTREDVTERIASFF